MTWASLICRSVLAAGAGWLTYSRNQDYRSDLTLWQDTVAKRPGGARAQSGLGTALLNRGDVAGAERHYAEAVRLEPDTAEFSYNVRTALAEAGRLAEAAEALGVFGLGQVAAAGA